MCTARCGIGGETKSDRQKLSGWRQQKKSISFTLDAHTINIDNVNTILSLNYWFGQNHRQTSVVLHKCRTLLFLEISKVNVSCWLSFVLFCFALLDLVSHICYTKKTSTNRMWWWDCYYLFGIMKGYHVWVCESAPWQWTIPNIHMPYMCEW